MINNLNFSTTFAHITTKFNAPLADYTYTKVGGPADIIAWPATVAELQELVVYANAHDLPWQVLGSGSNLIVRDGGIRGLVILLTKLNQITVNDTSITAGAGADLLALTCAARDHSLSGLEFAAGIPGSVGGAIFMNASAFHGAMQDVVTTVTYLTAAGAIATLAGSALDFGPEHSAFQEQPAIILAATVNLTPGDYATIASTMQRWIDLRNEKHPLEYPNNGAVFQQPGNGQFSGRLIQAAGLAGYCIGGVEVSTKHTDFMVNVDHGTAADYEALIAHVIQAVQASAAVTLVPAVRILGEK